MYIFCVLNEKHIFIHKYSIIIFVLLCLHICALNCWLNCAWGAVVVSLLDSPILKGIQLTKKRIWTDFMIYDGIQILHIIRYMFEDRIPGAWINVSIHIIYTYHSISNCTMMYWWACTIQWICAVHLTYIYIYTLGALGFRRVSGFSLIHMSKIIVSPKRNVDFAHSSFFFFNDNVTELIF